MMFKTPAGEAAFMACYDAALTAWPVAYQALHLPTRFGTTHVIAGGPADGPALVLLHASGTSSAVWIRNVAALSQTYRTFLVDIVGEPNKSVWSAPFRSRSDCAAWLADVMGGLGLKRAHLGGISYGGWQALNFALAAPEQVESLVLLAPAASFAKFRMAFFLHFLGPMLLPSKDRVRGTFRWLSANGQVVDERLAEQMYLAVRHFRFAKGGVFPTVYTDDELRRLRPPTLLLIGDHEVIYDPSRALDRARRLITGIEADLVQSAGHLLNMEQPDVVNGRMLAFLNRQVGTPC
ncbi:MAG: carboxylesterase [Symbiobacteriaceae bacterium]|jgi:pimeloyl-ACP methyl ester carboxylesterase|nr:carboxylesterase [Symbiobacteriaceae bacterium]